MSTDRSTTEESTHEPWGPPSRRGRGTGRLTTRDLAGVTHACPTYNDGAWNAAISDVQDQLERPTTRRALGALARASTWWVSRGD